MKLIRVIEEFMKYDNSLHKEYELNISTDKLLEILDDLELNEGIILMKSTIHMS